MTLVVSLLQAIVHVDGEALVLHVADKPYVVAPSGQIELASRGLTLEAVSGIVAQLLPLEFQQALDEFGAAQYDLPRLAEFPGERFTVVVARGGDDVWAEIRRHKVHDEDRIPEKMFGSAAAQEEEPLAERVVQTVEDDGLAIPDGLWASNESAADLKLSEPIETLPPIPEIPPSAAQVPASSSPPAPPSLAPKPVVPVPVPPTLVASQPIAPPPHVAAPRVAPPQAAPAQVMPPKVAPPEVAAPLVAALPVAPRQAAPPQVVPPPVAPPKVAAPPVAAPQVAAPPVAALPVAAPRVAPPQAAPPQAAPPQVVPPQVVPPKVAPPQAAPPKVVPPRAVPPPAVPPQAVRPQVVLPQVVVPPEVEAPQVVPPQVVPPQAAPPQVVPPQVVPPQVVLPQVVVPPEVAAPQVAAPQVVPPQVTAPHPAAPQVVPPQVAAPQAAAPQVVPPQAAPPQVVLPQVVVPPEVAAPEVAAPQVAAPQVVPPRAAPPAVVVPPAVVLPPAVVPLPRVVPPPPPPLPPAATSPPPETRQPSPAFGGMPQPAVVLPMTRSPIRSDTPPPLVTPALGLDRLLRIAAARSASTLYLSSEAHPSIRVDGEIQILEGEPLLGPNEVEALLLTLVPERSHEALRTGVATEWITDLEGVGRVRCMSFRDHRGPGGVFRMMPGRAVSSEQLGLSREIQLLAMEPQGLVLISGPRLNGKRTLISALVDLINRKRSDRVITIESEINVVHERGTSSVSQREVRGSDDDVLTAARAALREDPDVLVVELLRTAALINVAIEAASSGQLVIGGFPSHTTTHAIDRIINLYPPESRRQVQLALAENLRGVVAQVLLLKSGGGGRLAAREVLLNTPAVASVIAEGRTSQLPMAIEGGRVHGMVPLNDALVGLVQSGAVDVHEAHRHAADRTGFLALLKRQGIDTAALERLA